MNQSYIYKYNYVFFSDHVQEFYHIGHEPVNTDVCVRYYDFPLCNEKKIIRLLYRIHNSDRINRIIKLPLKKIWNKFFFRERFPNDKPICFVFSCEMLKMKDVNYFNYLRKKYQECKLLYLCTDKFDLIKGRYDGFDEDYLRKTFDYVLTYEVFDVKHHGLTYFQTLRQNNESIKAQISDSNSKTQSDVVFVGEAKDRLKVVLDVFNWLTSKGLKCDFYIAFAPQEIREEYPDITFGDSWIPYKEVVKKIEQSRCILDVVQGGAIGINARAKRAFEFNKMLVSNCKGIQYSKLYDGRNIQFFEKAEDINTDAIKNDISPEYNYSYLVNEMSPYKYLDLLLQGKTTAEEYYSDWIDLSELMKNI